jgi:hypothetical protein
MSETCSGVTFADPFLLEETSDDDVFTCVGRPVAGLSARIVDDSGQTIPEGQVGRLLVRGPMVLSKYHAASRDEQVFLPDGWFDTGDLGYLQDGQLTITGRRKDVVIVNGKNLFCQEIEAVVEGHPDVEPSFTAAVGCRPPGADTDQLVVVFHPRAEEDRLAPLLRQLHGLVPQRLGISAAQLLPVAKEEVPRTPSGKVQRAVLREQIETGAFDAVRKRVDLLLGDGAVLPNWFFRPSWRPCAAGASPAGPPGPALVLAPTTGPGREAAVALAGHLAATVVTEDDPRPIERLPGPVVIDFRWYAPFEDETASLETLDQHLVRHTDRFLSLLRFLTRANPEGRSLRLVLASAHAQAVEPGERVAPARAALLGLVRTASQEQPWLDARHLDLPPDSPRESAALVAAELRSPRADRQVAYRRGRRWVLRLEKVFPTGEPPRPLPFRPGGAYLITGGLGGVAAEVARFLLVHYQARLLLTGRSDGRAHPVRQLEQLPGQVVYEPVDCRELSRLREVIETWTGRCGRPLDGVLHLAGTYHERLLAEETTEGLLEVVRPKALGAVAALALAGNAPVLLFGSAVGFFGGALVGAYSAANRFLDVLTESMSCGAAPVRCLSWTAWEGIGLSRGHAAPEARRAQGYRTLSAQEAIHSFQAALATDERRVLIGLDGTNRNVLGARATTACSFRQVVGKVVLAPEAAAAAGGIGAEAVRDRFGAPVPCRIEPVTELSRGHSGPGAAEAGALAGAERPLCELWGAVLGASAIRPQDNFFEMGGHSLLALQLVERMKAAFGAPLALQDLLRAPTPAEMALVIEERLLDRIEQGA